MRLFYSLVIGLFLLTAHQALACPLDVYTSENITCHVALDNLESQVWLGDYYFTGSKTDPNYPKAEEWYLKAAKNGNRRAQIRLGFMYAENHFPGVTHDLTKGEHWFLQAAKQNEADGLFRMGNFYHHYSKPPNYEKTVYWLEKAATKNYGAAQYDLARIYNSDKLGTPKLDKSWGYMEAAAKNDIRQAQMAMTKHYEDQGEFEKALHWANKLANGAGKPRYWREKVIALQNLRAPAKENKLLQGSQ